MWERVFRRSPSQDSAAVSSERRGDAEIASQRDVPDEREVDQQAGGEVGGGAVPVGDDDRPFRARPTGHVTQVREAVSRKDGILCPPYVDAHLGPSRATFALT